MNIHLIALKMQHARKHPKLKSHLIVELIILLVIISSICYFAIPNINNMLDTSRQKSADNDAQIIAVVAETWLTEQQTNESVPAVDSELKLAKDEVEQIVEMATSIDEDIAKNVTIIVNGNQVPECYKLKSVNLVKSEYKSVINK